MNPHIRPTHVAMRMQTSILLLFCKRFPTAFSTRLTGFCHLLL